MHMLYVLKEDFFASILASVWCFWFDITVDVLRKSFNCNMTLIS